MKIRAAVLYEMGLPAPYAESKPLKIETLELDPPGKGKSWSAYGRQAYATRTCPSSMEAALGRCRWHSAMKPPAKW